MDKIVFPFGSAKLGSTINTTGFSFNSPVISDDSSIGKLNKTSYSDYFMSGESHYLHTENMNLGSFGVAGSYGFSAVEEIKNTTFGYVGTSASADSKNVAMNYNVLCFFGVESIDFRKLTVIDFVNSLTPDIKSQLLDVLDKYNKAVEIADKNNLSIPEAVQNSSGPYTELNAALRNWINACMFFQNRNGFGLVCSILWGAYGTVTLNLSMKGSDRQWKYGGSEEFSYLSTSSTVTVNAAYDGSNDNASANANLTITEKLSGGLIASDLTAWRENLLTLATGEIFGISPFSKAPSFEKVTWNYTYPEFKAAPEDPKTTESVDAMKPESQKDMATAVGFDSAKDQMSLNEFTDITGANKNKEKADTSGLKKSREDIDTNDIDISWLFENELNNTLETTVLATSDDHKNLETINDSDVVPLGVWLLKWPDLIPWLAVPVDNNAGETMDDISIEYRTLLQDLFTLNRIYLTANDSGVEIIKRTRTNEKDIITLAIGNEFGNLLALLQELSHISKQDIRKLVQGISAEAKSILDIWVKNTFLRNGELGMGIICQGRSVTPQYEKDKSVPGEYGLYTMGQCDYPAGNITNFSTFLKVLPLIHPNGNVYVFGPAEGGLTAVDATYAKFSSYSQPGFFMNFTLNTQEQCLERVHPEIKVYPIPLTAAKNVDSWTGFSIGTTIRNDHDLINNLSSLDDKYSELAPWSLSSQNWLNENYQWKQSDYYRISSLPFQYVGIVTTNLQPI